MKAVILSAGKGTRLGHMTTHRPKCLVEVGGRAILDHQVDALIAAGVDEIVVVAGYLADQVTAAARGRFRVITSDNYDTTNSIYSLWQARGEAAGQPFILLNGDVVADQELVEELVHCSSPCAALVDDDKVLRDGEMNVVIRNGTISAFSKTVRAAQASAESAQITKFGGRESSLLFERIEALVSAGETQHFPAQAYDAIFAHATMVPVSTGGRWHFEIDTPQDHENCVRFLERGELAHE